MSESTVSNCLLCTKMIEHGMNLTEITMIMNQSMKLYLQACQYHMNRMSDQCYSKGTNLVIEWTTMMLSIFFLIDKEHAVKDINRLFHFFV